MEVKNTGQEQTGRTRLQQCLSISPMKLGQSFFLRLYIIAACLFSMVLLPNSILAQEIVLISNADIPVSSLTRDEIKRIFLGKQTTLGDGKTNVVFAIQSNTEASRLFLKEYVEKSAYQYGIYWKKRVFAGKGRTPPSFSSDREVVAFVSETPGAVGYVSIGTDIGNAKIVRVQ